jgi:2,4-dienoyl-CoA reductase (NADPH2)
MEQRFAVDCAVNPRTGKERELAIQRAHRPKRVVVIGSGPAGMEAARVAAQRGHHVTLFERNTHTGGALLWASILHPENEPFLRWLRDELARSSVKLELGHEVSADDVVDLQPDAVVVANGGQVVLPDIAGSQLPHVSTGQALRERFGGWRQRLVRPTAVRVASRAWMPLGHRVVIIGADLVALELAEFLAARGRLVSVLESGKVIAPELGNKRRTEHMDRLDRLGVTIHVRATVHEIVPDGAVFTPYGGTSRQLPADSVVVAGTLQADTELHEKLSAAMPDVAVHAAGDCTGLGLIRKATEDGARAACAI